MHTCNGCDKQFREADIAPYQRNADGELTHACRRCINEWIADGILWGSIPFWMRREGKDQP